MKTPPLFPLSRCLGLLLGLGSFVSLSGTFSTAAEPAGVTNGVSASEKDGPAGIAFFESKIRPVLVEQCYECHSAEAGKSKGNLLLDSRHNIRLGGDTGPAIVPEDPEGSLLLAAIAHTDPDLEMPPKKAPLGPAIVADFRTWIEMGAPDPREGSAKMTERAPVTVEEGRKFWAYQKPQPHQPPKTSDPDWARRPLDHFVLAGLDAHGLTPSPDAAPPVLLRRLYFDLIGLPPSPKQLRAFEKRLESKGLDQALATEVDALLASEQFGERWGRHWLDVARYAESNGKESNLTYPHAWRYRNYVIDSVNDDTPYDQFLTEQIAGDLLPFDTGAERAEHLIATGFLALGAKGLNEMNKLQFFADLIDEQIDTVTRAVMATSVACARCHDHKFDPYSMRDYYALAGIFASTETFFGTAIGSENNVGGELITLPELEGQVIPNPSLGPEKVQQLKDQMVELDRREAEGRKDGTLTLQEAIGIYWKRGGIEGTLDTVDDQGNALPLCMGVLERNQVIDARYLENGEISKPGEIIPRDYPKVIKLTTIPKPPDKESGRLEFAQWLTHPDHPLTARVMANRVWSHLFGKGIVPTVDNFGFTGKRPTHPELLDHLALNFVENGWSVKRLVKEIVLSRAYRQSSDFREDYFLKDPDNTWVWRADKRRLDAECIRDAMLAVSGQLDLTRPEASLVAYQGNKSVSLFGFDKRIPPDLDGSLQRSVYLPVVRDKLPDVLDLFDFAEPSMVMGERETTNVPVQALYLMNSPFVQEQAAALAARLEKERETRPQQIRYAFQLCFNRAPDREEMKLASQFLAAADRIQQEEREKEQAPSPDTVTKTAAKPGAETPEPAPVSLSPMASYCQALLATAEFRNLD